MCALKKELDYVGRCLFLSIYIYIWYPNLGTSGGGGSIYIYICMRVVRKVLVLKYGGGS